MQTSLRQIVIIMSFVFSAQACVAEKNTHQNTRFIVQLTDASIQKRQHDVNQVETHRNTKLRQWSLLTGLTLKAISPTNQQRWIIKTNTQNPEHIKNLINTISIDGDVKYVEEDIIMNINLIQRPPKLLAPATP